MRDWALPLAILLVQVALFLRLPLFAADWLIPYDLPGYHLPLATHIVESLRAGRFPLWDNTTYCGFPFYANVQTQMFYPGAWPFFAAGAALGAERMLDILEWQVALHVWLGGAMAFGLARRGLGASVPAALLGATVFQLGGFFASQAHHLGVVCTAAWLPLVWLAALEGSTRRAAVGLAMGWLAGYPAAALVAGASGGLVAAMNGRGMAYAKGVVWAAALTGVQLLPAVELASWAGARDKAAYTGTGGGVPLQAFISMVWPNYHHVFEPAAYKLPWNRSYLYLYCGLLPLGAAIAGLVRRRTPGWVRVGAAVFTVWMLGETTPVWRWVFPALPARELIIPELVIMAFILTVAVAAVCGLRGLPDRMAWAAVAIAWADLTLAGSGTSLHAARRADTPLVTPSSFEGSAETLRKLREVTSAGGTVTPPWRIDVINDSTNWAASGPVHGIPMATGNDPLALSRIKEVRRIFARGDAWMHYYTVDKPESPVLDLLNVRYLLHWETAPGAALPGHELRENADALPRFFLVNRWVTWKRLEEIDIRREALVESDSGIWENPRSEAPDPVVVELYGSSRVRLRVKVPAGGAFLVTSEAYYPGWQAEIDGQPHDLVLANRAFRGLMLLPGEHVVTMRFRPWILAWGVVVSALAMGRGVARRKG